MRRLPVEPAGWSIQWVEPQWLTAARWFRLVAVGTLLGVPAFDGAMIHSAAVKAPAAALKIAAMAAVPARRG